MSELSDVDDFHTRKALRAKMALAFIVKNEGRYAVTMLESVLPIVGFVSCVDTGSTDDTVDIIERVLTDKRIPHSVVHQDFQGFDVARNRAIQNIPAHFEWIFMLDADEIILKQDFQKIEQLVSQSTHDAWVMPRYNWIDRVGGTFSEHYPDYQGRLFKRAEGTDIRYEGALHEQLSGYKSMGTVVASDTPPADPAKEIHIHHIKLFTKPEREVAEREVLYKELSARSSVRADLIDRIWGGQDPFVDKTPFEGRVDLQGWASDNPLLAKAINEVRPRIVVEVGVWKGGSVITMGREMKTLGIDGAIIAVDTWLGAWDHWIQPVWFESLRVEAGYPTLFRTFAANIVESDLQDIVVPLPLDSLNAAFVLKSKGLRPNVVHIDGAHDYHAVFADLRAWWPLLEPGGIMIGDDYHASGDTWPEVRAAFHEFFKTDLLENLGGKCYIRKLGE